MLYFQMPDDDKGNPGDNSNDGEPTKVEATSVLNMAKMSEASKMLELWRHGDNIYFREVKAKDAAGYNAAWKYHCTYESKMGPKEADVIKKGPKLHPAEK